MKNKLLAGLLSLGIAIGLWLYVVTVISPNSDKHYYNVPIDESYLGTLESRGLTVVDKGQTTVSLHLEGNRTDLDKLNKSNITILLDVSRVYEAGVHEVPFSVTYPGDVPNNAISVLKKNPGTITIEVDHLVTKTVPVVLYYRNQKEDYMVDKENRELDYEEINITGPAKVIDTIAMARVDVDLSDRIQSIDHETFVYSLCNEAGEPVDARRVTTDVESLLLTLEIRKVKEVPLVLKVVSGGGATEETAIITIDPLNVLISGDDSFLAAVDQIELGTVNLGDVTDGQVLTFPIKMPNKDVENMTGVAEASVQVQFPDLGTKTLTVTKFKAMNEPSGLKADVVTKQLEIQVRGPKEIIDTVTEQDILVTVDFGNEQLGTATVKADVTVNVEGVGAVGTYNITATLKKK